LDKGDEKADGDSRQGHPSGWVYMLENKGMPSLFKIGMTIHNPHLRASELSRETGIPAPFFVRKAYFVKDRCKAEKLIHKELDSYRYNENREFFQNTDWGIFRDIIEEILSEHRLLDECTFASRLNWLEDLNEAGDEIRAELEKDLEEANKKNIRLKGTIEKLQNANQDNDTTIIAELP
jgi:hypothetical protein